MKIRFIPHTEEARKKLEQWDGNGGVWDGSCLEGEPNIPPAFSRRWQKAKGFFEAFKNAQVSNLAREGVEPEEYTLEVVL
jgi:hypothetical protein